MAEKAASNEVTDRPEVAADADAPALPEAAADAAADVEATGVADGTGVAAVVGNGVGVDEDEQPMTMAATAIKGTNLALFNTILLT